MFQTLRIGVKGHVPRQPVVPVVVPSPRRRKQRGVVMDLDYRQVKNAMVISELDTFGHEMPIAIAYVTVRGRIVVGYITELAELESEC